MVLRGLEKKSSKERLKELEKSEEGHDSPLQINGGLLRAKAVSEGRMRPRRLVLQEGRFQLNSRRKLLWVRMI